jgi:hypothetical protein
VTLLSGAEHQRLIDANHDVRLRGKAGSIRNLRAKSLYFGLSLLESRLELLSGHLEVLDVSRSAV